MERKAGFIAQVMRGRIAVRDMEDVGDTALSFAEAKVLATGDPLVLDPRPPGMDGWELTDRLRSRYPRCPIASTSVLDVGDYPPPAARCRNQ